eukprot:UN30421
MMNRINLINWTIYSVGLESDGGKSNMTRLTSANKDFYYDMLINIQPDCTIKLYNTPTCGVLWFYHIPKTGGTSVKEYGINFLEKQVLSWKIEKFYQQRNWGGKFNVIKHIIYGENENVRTKDQLKKLTPGSMNNSTWYMVQHHNESPPIGFLERPIHEMRNYVENVLGCKFLMTSVIREPIRRQLSHIFYKFSFVPNNTLDEWIPLYQNYICHYYLFNWCHRDERDRLECGADPEVNEIISKEGLNWGLHKYNPISDEELFKQTVDLV